MFLFFEIGSPAGIEAIFVSIPESVGVLFFGVGLVVLAGVLRAVIGRIESPSDEIEAEAHLVGR